MSTVIHVNNEGWVFIVFIFFDPVSPTFWRTTRAHNNRSAPKIKDPIWGKGYGPRFVNRFPVTDYYLDRDRLTERGKRLTLLRDHSATHSTLCIYNIAPYGTGEHKYPSKVSTCQRAHRGVVRQCHLLRLKLSSNAWIVYPAPSYPLSSPLRARDCGPALESFPHLLPVVRHR